MAIVNILIQSLVGTRSLTISSFGSQGENPCQVSLVLPRLVSVRPIYFFPCTEAASVSIKECWTQLRGTWNAIVGFEFTMNYLIAILDHKYSMDRVENYQNAKVGYENTTRNIVFNHRRGALDSNGTLSKLVPSAGGQRWGLQCNKLDSMSRTHCHWGLKPQKWVESVSAAPKTKKVQGWKYAVSSTVTIPQ